MSSKQIRMLRTIGEYEEGKVYPVDHYKALGWVETGVASLRLDPPAPTPPLEVEDDVEVHGKAPKRAPVNRMARRAAVKG